MKTRVNILDSLAAKLVDGSAEANDEVEDTLYLIFQNWSDLKELEIPRFVKEFRSIV